MPPSLCLSIDLFFPECLFASFFLQSLIYSFASSGWRLSSSLLAFLLSCSLDPALDPSQFRSLPSSLLACSSPSLGLSFTPCYVSSFFPVHSPPCRSVRLYSPPCFLTPSTPACFVCPYLLSSRLLASSCPWSFHRSLALSVTHFPSTYLFDSLLPPNLI